MKLTLDQALQQGIAALREGKLQDAERLYRAILQAQPNHPDANYYLGVLAVTVGKPLEALPLFKRALDGYPQIEKFWLSYIDTLIQLERFDEANRVLVEGERGSLSSDKLDALKRRVRERATADTKEAAMGLSLSEKRKKVADKKKSKKTRTRSSPSIAGPAKDRINRFQVHYQAGRLEEAESLAKSLTEHFPSLPFGWKALGTLLKQTGRVGDSLAPMQLAVKLSPHDAEAHCNLGVTLRELGRLDDAEASHRQAIVLKPDNEAFHNNLGNTLRDSGRLVEAEASFRQALALQPDYTEAHSNLGNTLRDLGRLDEAEASYRQAITLKPDYLEAYNNLGNTLLDLGRLDEAEASYRKVITLKPDYAQAHNNLGVTLEELGRPNDAEAMYRKAIALNPDYANAYLNLCEFFEKTNAIDKLSTVLEGSRLKTHTKKADFVYYQALIAFRRERYEEADALLSQITEGEISSEREALFYKLKGDLSDRKQDYDAAFSAYERSNHAVKGGLEHQRLKAAANYYFEAQKSTARQLEQLSRGSPFVERPSKNGRQPSFLVGFPRSGTTLLDTILRTHSRIEVIEEQPMVAKMSATLGGLEDIRLIEMADNDRLSAANDTYLEELHKHTMWPDGSLVIDKLPLNILKAPCINRVYPDSKFILALRHPFDCILSCWMQSFRLNAAMANMVDLDRIVDVYCIAMKIFKLSEERYRLNAYRIRYEDLVKDFEAETTSMLRFLGLEWESGLVNYQTTAHARGKINTPSRWQVIKPIYKTAAFRWKHYRKHLGKYESQLAPWLDEFGYEL